MHRILWFAKAIAAVLRVLFAGEVLYSERVCSFSSLHLLFDHKIHLYSVCALCVSIFPFSIFACQMLDSIM